MEPTRSGSSLCLVATLFPTHTLQGHRSTTLRVKKYDRTILTQGCKSSEAWDHRAGQGRGGDVANAYRSSVNLSERDGQPAVKFASLGAIAHTTH